MNMQDVFDTGLKNAWYLKKTVVFAVAMVSFATGSLITTRLANVHEVKADSNRIFELRIYHAAPGKVAALETRFRETASPLLAKHGLKSLGYWVPEAAPAWDNTFVYILVHPSRREATENWDALRADPAFQAMSKSEQTEKLVEKVDSTYMQPTEFSPMK